MILLQGGKAGRDEESSSVTNRCGLQMSWRGANTAGSPAANGGPIPEDSEVAGTVIVRDIVSRAVIAHFRAHTSPLLLMRFDGSGSLLVTASVHGHSVNVFHVGRGASKEAPGAAAHLFHLSRGLTPALIQDVSFSCCGRWLCCSSARVHIFCMPSLRKNPPEILAAGVSTAARKEVGGAVPNGGKLWE